MAAKPQNFVQFYDDGVAALDAGCHADAISALEKALALNPGDPATLFALGEAAAQIGLHQAAARFFRETLTRAPGRHEATIRLARALMAQMHHGDAIDTLRDALAHAPEVAGLWLALGNAVREIGDADNASTFYREALRLNPESVEALGNLADILFDLGNITDAIQYYDEAIRRAPENAQLRVNRAVALLAKGNVEAGWRDYEYRLLVPGRAIERRNAPQRWDGAPRGGRTLLIMAEQGIGDQIAFGAFIPQLLKDGPVILECEPRLEALFSRSLRGVTVRGCTIRREGAHLYSDYGWATADLSVDLASLPHFCGGQPSDASPWLKPEPSEQMKWRDWRMTLGARAVGISWRSGHTGGIRGSQYAPLARWAQFIGKLDTDIVVAQYGVDAGEIATLEALSGKTLIVPPNLDQKNDIDRSAAMLSTLDAVVSAPTAVASIAGAMGVPTYKALHYRSWTSLGADREPFMPSVLCVTPPHAGQWRNVFEQILSRIG